MNDSIAVIGLGYVGLPLAVEFAKHYEKIIGFDISAKRVAELEAGEDHTQEAAPADLKDVTARGALTFTTEAENLREAIIFIVTVPTPIDGFKKPDLRPLLAASAVVGGALKKGDIVIYESTVYPGATEEECVPILEQHSGLKYNEDFYCGYSPERINPGDKKHTVAQIMKVTSGSTPEIAERVDSLYARVIRAGTHKASSIRVAEAAKVIENAQRDINIAFVNELALIFRRLGIDTREVLEAAGTKWNFLPFRPGLVGGHCIGVDPYYLTHKAEAVGYHPEVILSGRRINDDMGRYVAGRLIKLMIGRGLRISGARTLVLGITFKENCPDIRNSRVIDIVRELAEYGCRVDVYDPWADPVEVRAEYGIELITSFEELEAARKAHDGYEGICLAVAHQEFAELDVPALLEGAEASVGGPAGGPAGGRDSRAGSKKRPEADKRSGAVFDVKSFLPPGCADERL